MLFNSEIQRTINRNFSKSGKTEAGSLALAFSAVLVPSANLIEMQHSNRQKKHVAILLLLQRADAIPKFNALNDEKIHKLKKIWAIDGGAVLSRLVFLTRKHGEWILQ
jgi:hypothetical protein